MSELLIQSGTLTDIADAIRAKTGGSASMTPSEMVTAIGNISGSEEWVEALSTIKMSDNYSYGNTITINLPQYITTLANLFNRLRTNSNRALVIKQHTSGANITSLNAMCGSSYFGDITLNLDSSHATTFESAFQGVNPSNIYGTPIDFSSVSAARGVQNMFYNASRLQEVRFAAGTLSYSLSLSSSSALTTDSLASIVAGLKDMTGQTAQTLTLHATPKALLTAEQIATITAKNWTLA